MRRLLLTLAVLPLAGCIAAAPAPLDPKASLDALSARGLDDPKLSDALARAGLAADGSWTLDRLTVAAWTFRPEVALVRAEAAQSLAAARAAGEIPNPTFSFDPSYLYDNAGGSLSPWTVAASLGFTIETGGKRGIREAQALAEATSRQWQVSETLWKVRQDVRRAWTARAFARRALDLAEREAALRQSFSAWVETALRFGAVAQPERLAAITALSQAQSALRTARGNAAAADAALAAALGVTLAHVPFDRLEPLPEALPEPAMDTALRIEALTNRLGIRHALADYDVAEEALRLAVARQYPDISFGPGYTYDKGDRGVTLTLGFTLPVFHGERAAIDEALAARAKAAAQFAAEQTQALGEIESAAGRYAAAYAAWSETPAAVDAGARAAAAAEARLQSGAGDRSEQVTAALAQVAAERAALESLRAAVEAIGALEDGVQKPLWPASALAPARPDDRIKDMRTR